MANDFLDNYKKKSEQDMAEIADNTAQAPHVSSAQNSAPQTQQQAPQVQPSAVPPANGGNSGLSGFVQSTAPTTAPEKQSTAKPTGEGAKTKTSAASTNTAPPQNTAPQMNFEQKSGFAPLPQKPQSGGSGNGSRSRRKKFPWGYIIGGAVALIAVIVLIIALSGGNALPAMVGWSEGDAELWARENEVLLQVETVHSDEVPAGQIISQTPSEGEEIASGEFVKLVISAGPDLSIMVPVPDILNMTMQEVEAWAEENRMETVRITTEESETIPSGEAIRFYVNDNTVLGTEIRRDTPFYVIFSRGQGEGEDVKLPNFLTMSLEEAKTFATENGIVLSVIEEFSESVAEGSIIRQDIKAEETVREGDAVKIYVSLGKEIIVPNFFEMSKEEAALKATQLGITTLVTERYVTPFEEGDLVSQSISAGALYETGDIVELVYSLGFKVVVQSFVGKTEPDVRAWVEPYNKLGANIKVNTTYTSSTQPAGTILSQDKIDYTMTITDTLNLVVSKGKIVYVPNFISPGMTREEAIAVCEQLNIVPVFVEEVNSSVGTGVVFKQALSPGVEIAEETTITLTYNPGQPTVAKVTVPNFVGMTKAEVENYLVANNLKLTIDYFEDTTAINNGLVTAQVQNAGDLVDENSVINLTIGVMP